jgi:hypothetical protein
MRWLALTQARVLFSAQHSMEILLAEPTSYEEIQNNSATLSAENAAGRH